MRHWKVVPTLLGALLIGAGAMGFHAQSALAGSYLFDNFNGGGVQNNPPLAATAVHFDQTWDVTTIATYHWNNGAGKAPGTISIQCGWSCTPGPKQSFPASGENGNTDWVATVNKSFPPGYYLISDSDQTTWSWNSQSQFANGAGFVRISGTAVAPPPPPQPPAPQPPVPQPPIQLPPLPVPGPQPGCGAGAAPLPAFEPNQAQNLYFSAIINPCSFQTVINECNFYSLRAVVVRGEYDYAGRQAYPKILTGCVQ